MNRPRSPRPFPKRKPINLSRGAFRALAAALGVAALLGASSAAHAAWDNCTLVTADMHEQRHLSINTWTASEGLSATDEKGNLVNFPSRNILSLASGEESSRQTVHTGWTLKLRNGDTLFGSPAGVKGNYLLFDAPDIDENLAIPIKMIDAIVAPAAGGASSPTSPTRLPDAGAQDLVIFKNSGDKLQGTFDGLDAQSLQFQADGATKDTAIDLSTVQAIVFGGSRPPRTIPPLSVRISFASSTLTVPLAAQPPRQRESFTWSLAQASLTDALGAAHALPVSRINHMEIVGGRIVFLTEIDPDSETQISFIGSPWPFQVNKNVIGQELRVGRNSFARGIGVHTQSTLTYTLDGSFDTFTVRVGLDDSAEPLGAARASIVLDGKILWHADALKPGELSSPITLPVKGGRQLELHADPANHLDVQGRVDWIEPALLRD